MYNPAITSIYFILLLANLCTWLSIEHIFQVHDHSRTLLSLLKWIESEDGLCKPFLFSSLWRLGTGGLYFLWHVRIFTKCRNVIIHKNKKFLPPFCLNSIKGISWGSSWTGNCAFEKFHISYVSCFWRDNI